MNTKLYIAYALVIGTSIVPTITFSMHCAPNTQRRLNAFGIMASQHIDDTITAAKRWFIQRERDTLLQKIAGTKGITERSMVVNKGIPELIIQAQAIEMRAIKNTLYWNRRWCDVQGIQQFTEREIRSLKFKKKATKLVHKTVQSDALLTQKMPLDSIAVLSTITLGTPSVLKTIPSPLMFLDPASNEYIQKQFPNKKFIIIINPKYLGSCTINNLQALMFHETHHAALNHSQRVHQDTKRLEIEADIGVLCTYNPTTKTWSLRDNYTMLRDALYHAFVQGSYYGQNINITTSQAAWHTVLDGVVQETDRSLLFKYRPQHVTELAAGHPHDKARHAIHKDLCRYVKQCKGTLSDDEFYIFVTLATARNYRDFGGMYELPEYLKHDLQVLAQFPKKELDAIRTDAKEINELIAFKRPTL